MKKVDLIIESIGSHVITAQEEIFDYVESKANVDEMITSFVQEKRLIDVASQKAQRELRKIVDQYFINEVSMAYEHIQNEIETLNVDVNAEVETEFFFEIPDVNDFQDMLEGNFDYEDYLNDWILKVANETQNISTGKLINFYYQNPRKAWENVDNPDVVIKEVQESGY